MKKLLVLLMLFSLFTINNSSALMIAVPELKLEYKLQNRVDNIFINIEKKISNRDLSYKQGVYDTIIKKVGTIYNKYPNLSGRSLLLMEYIENKATEQKDNLLVDDVFGGIIEEEEPIDSYTEDGEYILGNKDAQISFIEYSDIECPFCARLHSAGTIDEVLEKYDGKVNFKFKHFPLSFHKKAQVLAHASECAGEQGGADKYYGFIFSAFKNHSKLHGEYFISDIVDEIGLDKSKFDICMKSEKYNDKIDNQMKEGSELGVRGTPGNVIMDNSSGDFKIVSGAHPTESFVKTIDEMLK